MTTRSGRQYRASVSEMSDEEQGATSGPRKAEMNIADMMRMFIEDRQRRDEEIAAERQRREEQMREQVELEKQQMREQMDMLRRLVEESRQREVATPREQDVKVAKLTDKDDIEAYLTTFERLMKAYEVREDRWVYKLAPPTYWKGPTSLCRNERRGGRRLQEAEGSHPKAIRY